MTQFRKRTAIIKKESLDSEIDDPSELTTRDVDWPSVTHLRCEPNKPLKLLAQKPAIRHILQKSIEATMTNLLTDYAFPNAKTCTKTIRDFIYDAAADQADIRDRMMNDLVYLHEFTKVVSQLLESTLYYWFL